ncbi:unnamed protein product [Prorocentrum cordatum]|nr:unnamed protein product [Polarella glacialis]
MSSIQAAIFNDCQKGRLKTGEGNKSFVALTSGQEKQGDKTNDDFHEMLQRKRAEEKQKRLAEGGKGGGFNDRQSEADRICRPAAEETSAASTSSAGARRFQREGGRRGQQDQQGAGRARAAAPARVGEPCEGRRRPRWQKWQIAGRCPVFGPPRAVEV